MKKIIFFTLLSVIMFISNDIILCDKPNYNAAEIPKGKIIVYPNPWIPESSISTREDTDKKNTLKHGHLSAEGWIKFAGMQKETGSLKIYDITGNLVRNFRWNAEYEKNNFPVSQYEFSEIHSETTPSTITYDTTQEYYDIFEKENPYKIIHWDGKDNNFEYVKSGIYIWILTEDGGRSHNGKLVVIR